MSEKKKRPAPISRREFVIGGARVAALMPFGSLLSGSLLSARGLSCSVPSHLKDRVLVVVQLSGGNDGLNMVVPHQNDDYYRARPVLAIRSQNVLKLNDEVGLNPRMEGLKELFDEGQLAVIQGVGYPRPNRSHFRSMDIWHTAAPEGPMPDDGWLGRVADRAETRKDPPAMHVGGLDLPRCLIAQHTSVPSVPSVDSLRRRLVKDRSMELSDRLMESPREGELEFLRSTAASTYDSARRLESLLKRERKAGDWPNTSLARALKVIAGLISSGFEASVYHVSLGGFDTHAYQQRGHDPLMTQLSAALSAFQRDLQRHGQAERVLTVSFSEFGRRVKENGSQGTDHGAAAPMFALSAGIRGGVYGPHPSLTDLDDGDLKHHTDFRSVYASCLDWLDVDAKAVLGGEFPRLKWQT